MGNMTDNPGNYQRNYAKATSSEQRPVDWSSIPAYEKSQDSDDSLQDSDDSLSSDHGGDHVNWIHSPLNKKSISGVIDLTCCSDSDTSDMQGNIFECDKDNDEEESGDDYEQKSGDDYEQKSGDDYGQEPGEDYEENKVKMRKDYEKS